MLKKLAAIAAAIYMGCVPPNDSDSGIFKDSSLHPDSGTDAAEPFVPGGEYRALEYAEEKNGMFTRFPREKGGCSHSLEGLLSLNNITTGSPESFGNYYLLLKTTDSCTGITQTISLYDAFSIRKDTGNLVLQIEGPGFLEFEVWEENARLHLRYLYWNSDDPATLVLEPKGNAGECFTEAGHCYESPGCKENWAYSCIPEDICLDLGGGYKLHMPNHAEEACTSNF